MEEKERYYYKKILRDCVMPEGLFEIKDREGNFYLIIENKKDVDTITNLLNQQDARINELKNQVEKWKQDYENCSKLEKNLTKEHQYCLDNWRECEKENQQLKEKLNNFETLMKKYNVEDIEQLDIMLFVLSGNTKYHLKEIKDKHKKELKQSQNQKAIEELEKMREKFGYKHNSQLVISSKYLCDFIDNQIKELRGEDNETR